MINVAVIYTAGFEFDKEQEETLVKDFPGCRFVFKRDGEITPPEIGEADVMVGFPLPEQVKMASHLKWLHLSSIGVDKHVNRELYCNQDAVLTNSAGTYGMPISDHVLGLMLMLSRNLHYFRDQQSLCEWKKMDSTKDLFRSTLCIVGLGDVGRTLAVKARNLGMKVIGVKRTMIEKPEYLDELYTSEQLNEVIPRADFVVLSLATTKETVHIMDRNRLSLLRKDAYLINIGRGALIDQEALYEFLKNDRFAGAAIDVTTPEPLPPDSPLWGLKNLIITPHVSGKSPSTGQRQFSVFYENLSRYVNNDKMKNIIDFELMY
ncbi:D-2-hydroxyacid dehydrogenase [Clostridium sp. chh4-2]|uniref:D-2-hydroxyacid dehydrogenase n=1 Tax=Clostridium sp. chh4-2 TaxID=2067550 RepID=UPI000CCE7541|nr:D-2-hydroxyacid dehydrogenase [Clostridium sp. chh4-2]PNV61420.1 D-2-hydroxyacid dehydrogenase [Clostridium sp. chh4-2]